MVFFQVSKIQKKLVDNIKRNIFKQKILDYMRKSGIKKLTSYYLVIIKRRNDLFILVHRTQVIKRINQLKIALHFIRLWRLYLKLIKERRAQLEKMEKSFNFTYRKISGDIFLDSEEEKSVQTQMMTFIDNVYYEKFERKKRTVFKSLNSFYYTPEKNNEDNLCNNNINLSINVLFFKNSIFIPAIPHPFQSTSITKSPQSFSMHFTLMKFAFIFFPIRKCLHSLAFVIII